VTDERRARGERVRREVLGDARVDHAIKHTSDFTRPFQEFLTGAAWADVWGRPGLDRRTRSAVTLAVLTALGAENELQMHVRAARRHGLTPAEIGEILLQTAVYAGLPRANAAFAIADEVLREAEDGSG
jgi:4-carboxymuconolactone decarboxylase